MYIPPFWGMPDERWNYPDPLIWWVLAPIWAYSCAIGFALQISWAISLYKEDK